MKKTWWYLVLLTAGLALAACGDDGSGDDDDDDDMAGDDDDDMMTPCESSTETDGSGDFSVTAAEGSLIGYRLCPGPTSGFAESVQYNLVADPNMTAEGSSAQTTILILLPESVDAPRVQAGRGIVSAAIEDCNGDDVYGVAIRYFLGNGTLLEDSATFATRYFDGIGLGSPTTGREFTHVDGRYAAINGPGNQDFIIGSYGIPAGETEPQLLSCERVFAIGSPDASNPTITILTSRPLRDDSPVGDCLPADDPSLNLPTLPTAQIGDNEDEDDVIDPGSEVDADFSCIGDPLDVGDDVEVTVNVANGLNRDDINANTPFIFLPDNEYF